MQILVIVRNRCIWWHVRRGKDKSSPIKIRVEWGVPSIGRIVSSFRECWWWPFLRSAFLKTYLVIQWFNCSRWMIILRMKIFAQILILLISEMSFILRRQLATIYMILFSFWSPINRWGNTLTLSIILIVSWWIKSSVLRLGLPYFLFVSRCRWILKKLRFNVL